MLEPEDYPDFPPVTQELRKALMGKEALHRLDEIDAAHAALELENALLRAELGEAREQGEPEQAEPGPGRVTLSVRPFHMGTIKEAALKPLEEASEAHAAWQEVSRCEHAGGYVPCTECSAKGCCDTDRLAAEIADTITACVNLAARYGLDLQGALDGVEAANKERGRYGETGS